MQSPISLLLALVFVLAWTVPTEAAAQDGDAADHRTVVAVLYFDNHTASERFDPLGKGFAEMLITDLSGLSMIRVVERARLQDLIDEQELSRSQHSDPATALRAGRILAAEYVVTGSFTGIEPDIRAEAHLTHTETAEIVRGVNATGTEDQFFTIQEELAAALIEGMQIALSDEEAEEFRSWQEQNRIEDAETVVAYSEALDYYDREEYLEAVERMGFVVRRAPASALVQMTYDRMRQSAEDHARQESRSFLGRLLRSLIGGE